MNKKSQIEKIVLIISEYHSGTKSEAERIAEALVGAGVGDAERFEILPEVDPLYEGGVKFRNLIRPKQYEEGGVGDEGTFNFNDHYRSGISQSRSKR